MLDLVCMNEDKMVDKMVDKSIIIWIMKGLEEKIKYVILILVWIF